MAGETENTLGILSARTAARLVLHMHAKREFYIAATTSTRLFCSYGPSLDALTAPMPEEILHGRSIRG